MPCLLLSTRAALLRVRDLRGGTRLRAASHGETPDKPSPGHFGGPVFQAFAVGAFAVGLGG